MINLLSAEDKILIKEEYFRRLIVIIGFFLFIFICIAIILLFPSYFLLVSQEENLESQLNILRQSFNREKVADIESSVLELNSKLISFKDQEKNTQPISDLIKKVSDARPSVIKLSYISYQQGAKKEGGSNQISLQGYAATRDALIDFTNILESLKAINKVRSSPSNLLKEKDITFSLIIELNP